MPVFSHSGSFRLPAIISLLLSVNSQMIWWATPVQAQSLLQQLFGLSSAPQSQATSRMIPSPPLGGKPPLRMYIWPPPSGSGGSSSGSPQEGSGSYTTVCVRMCDGYYFPISHRAPRGRFYRDADLCRSRCGSSDAQLFYYSSNGGDMNSAVDLSGRSYARLPIAFMHRKKLVSGCACKPEPWSDAALNRHQRYALAEGTGLPGSTRGTGQLSVVAGNYAMPSPYHGAVPAGGKAARIDNSTATEPDPASNATADGDAAPTASSAPIEAEPHAPGRSAAAATEPKQRPPSTVRRTGSRGGPTPSRHGAAKPRAAPIASAGLQRKPNRVAMAASVPAGKHVWPGDAPTRTR